MYCVYVEFDEETEDELTTSFIWFEDAEEFFRMCRRKNESVVTLYEIDSLGNKIRTIAQYNP